MSIMAGIVGLVPHRAIPARACEMLRASLTRSGHGKLLQYDWHGAFFAKVDFGVWGSPGFVVSPEGGACIVTGEPQLQSGGSKTVFDRQADVEALSEMLGRRDLSILTRANGVFAVARFDAKGHRLTLATDKLGIRPVYVSYDATFLVFSTALHVLEALDFVPRVMDLQGVTQEISLGFPLGRRTPYARISRLESGEVITVDDSGIRRCAYHRWDGKEIDGELNADWFRRVQASFSTAIKRRAVGRSSALAFLSGGLDSRCVVAGLRDVGQAVESFGFSLPGSQDDVFGRLFAAACGCRHHALERPKVLTEEGAWSFLMARTLDGLGLRPSLPAADGHVAWSGDGGSVGVGCAYLTDAVVRQLREGQQGLAIEAFLKSQSGGLSKGILRRELAHELPGATSRGVADELAKIRSQDPIRAFHLFLMKNDQRRHLSGHFETIDLHRLELQLPFYDSEFLELMLALPISALLRHRFYHRWLGEMPPAVRSVPWQTYPGHEACSIAGMHSSAYQWSRETLTDSRRHLRRRLLEEAAAALRADAFPEPLLDKRACRLAWWFYRVNARESSCALRTIVGYQRRWANAGGQYEWVAEP